MWIGVDKIIYSLSVEWGVKRVKYVFLGNIDI